MTTKTLFSLLFALLAASMLGACGGGGGGSPPTFSLTFEAPDGNGLADGQVTGVRYQPDVTQDFTFSAGVAASGRVTDGAGDPITNAKVSFRPSSTARDVDSDRTNDSGNYSVTLSAGRWIATIDSNVDEIGTMTVGDLVVLDGVPAVFDFQFPAAESVVGTAFSSTGSGLDSARITFTGEGTGATVEVQCDPNGLYSADLCPDTYHAVVRPIGTDAATQLKQRFTVNVLVGPILRDFTLTAGVQVSGTVFNHAGLRLLEETKIRVILPAGSDFFAPDDVRADEDDGSYSVGPVPFGTVAFQLEAPGETGLPVQRFTRTVAGPTAQTEDFTLALGLVLRGTILRDDGLTPAREVKVEPLPTNGSLAPDDVKTDDLGFYEIALFPGTYDVHITPKEDNQQLPETRRVTVGAPMVLDITLKRGVLLRGVVRYPDGITLAEDIRVEVAGVVDADDKTNGDGEYSLLVPEGTHTLGLSARDGSLEDMALEPVSGVVVAAPGPVVRNITLVTATSGSTVVHGVLMSADGVTPISDAEVVARDERGDTIGRAISDGAGQYTLVIP
ncbi:MAG: hypothetical protein ACYTGZ_10425 [Planctomycetota bacterium]|jgi:hypothetical protein